MSKLIKTIIKAAQFFWESNQLNSSAALAYYAVFSLPAVLFIVLKTSSMLFNHPEMTTYIYNELGGLIGNNSAQSLHAAVEALALEEGKWWRIALSVFVLLFSATTVFAILQSSFNRILEVNNKAEGWTSLWNFIKGRLWSLGVLIGLGFILLISLVFDTFISAFSHVLTYFVQGIEVLFIVLGTFVIPIVMLTGLFILLFRLLPDLPLKTKDVLHTSLLTSFLFLIGKYAIGFYIGSTNPGSVYESAAAVVVILVWSYYSSAIILFGCCFLRERLRNRNMLPIQQQIEETE